MAQAATTEPGGLIGLGFLPHQIVLRPLVTEKGVHRASRNNQYAFEIHPEATKGDVRTAIESLFNVEVSKVCTQTRKGKARRYGSGWDTPAAGRRRSFTSPGMVESISFSMIGFGRAAKR